MTRPPTPLPAELGATFSTHRALRAGTSAGRLRAADMVAPFHGTRMLHPDAAPADERPLALDRRERMRVLELARAYSAVMPEGAFYCGRTASVLLGLPMSHGSVLEVGVLAPARAPRAKGVAGRRVAAHLVRVRPVHGLPVSSPASTWAMLGRELSLRDLVIVGDAIVRVPRDDLARRHPELALGTMAQLQAAIDAGRRAGADRLRDALARVRVGSSSPLETDHRLLCEDAGLPEPDLDVEIRDDDGRLLGISEFVYPDHAVLTEVEGDHHRTSRAQWNRDLEKYEAYAQHGWRVVRVSSAHIRSRNRDAVHMVTAALRARGWQP